MPVDRRRPSSSSARREPLACRGLRLLVVLGLLLAAGCFDDVTREELKVRVLNDGSVGLKLVVTIHHPDEGSSSRPPPIGSCSGQMKM